MTLMTDVLTVKLHEPAADALPEEEVEALGFEESLPVASIELDLEYILRIAGDYELALAKEYELAFELEEALAYDAQLTAEKVTGWLESGEISGKNKEARDFEQTVLMAGDEDVSGLRAHMFGLKLSHGRAKANVEALSAKVSLLKAWMYSKSGSARY